MVINSEINLKHIKNLRVAQSFTDAKLIKSMDFHYNGELLAYSQTSDGFSDLNEIKVLNLSNKVEQFGLIKVHKYGAGKIKFLDHENILTTSEKIDDSLRILNVQGRTYVSYFAGHGKEVTSISTFNQYFISGSKDKTVGFWDVRTPVIVKKFDEFSSSTCVDFHPAGEIFAVAFDDSKIRMYDSKTKTVADEFEFEKISGVEWKGLKFSKCGKFLMVTTNSTSILIIDPLTGEELHNFKDYENPDNQHIEACFSIARDSRFVFGGSYDGKIRVWDMKNSETVHKLNSGFAGPCYNVIFNPKFMNLASSGEALHLWIEKD